MGERAPPQQARTGALSAEAEHLEDMDKAPIVKRRV
jgi:hypothetical protein